MWKFRLCCNHRAYSDKTLALIPVCWENADKHKSIYGKSNGNKMGKLRHQEFYVETLLNKGKNHGPRGATDITIVKNFTLCSHEYNTQSDYYTLKRNNTLLVSVLLKYRSHSIFLHRLFSYIVYGIPHFALKMVFLSNLVCVLQMSKNALFIEG